jgi:hypothetical protein
MSLARDMGFRMSGVLSAEQLRAQIAQHTWNSTTSAAAAEMVYNSSITFDNAINGKVGAVSGVGDFLILKDSESGLDGFGCGSTRFEKFHRHFGSTIAVNSRVLQ